jgi:hypothetical protein
LGLAENTAVFIIVPFVFFWLCFKLKDLVLPAPEGKQGQNEVASSQAARAKFADQDLGTALFSLVFRVIRKVPCEFHIGFMYCQICQISQFWQFPGECGAADPEGYFFSTLIGGGYWAQLKTQPYNSALFCLYSFGLASDVV